MRVNWNKEPKANRNLWKHEELRTLNEEETENEDIYMHIINLQRQALINEVVRHCCWANQYGDLSRHMS